MAPMILQSAGGNQHHKSIQCKAQIRQRFSPSTGRKKRFCMQHLVIGSMMIWCHHQFVIGQFQTGMYCPEQLKWMRKCSEFMEFSKIRSSNFSYGRMKLLQVVTLYIPIIYDERAKQCIYLWFKVQCDLKCLNAVVLRLFKLGLTYWWTNKVLSNLNYESVINTHRGSIYSLSDSYWDSTVSKGNN